jgi:hypothetical protein
MVRARWTKPVLGRGARSTNYVATSLRMSGPAYWPSVKPY